jgi:hypothetical protein
VTNGDGVFGLTGSAINFNKVTVRGCVAGDRGGAIATLGDLTVIASTLNNCTGLCYRSITLCLLCLAVGAATTAAATTAAAIGAAATAAAEQSCYNACSA